MVVNVGEILASAVNTLKTGKVYLVSKNTYIDKMIAHFDRLNEEDRRLRFGINLGHNRICHYVKDMIKDGDFVFAVFSDSGDIIALLHMARAQGKAYELGLSVDENHRQNGYASALFTKAITFAKTLGAKRVYTYCLNENRAMQNLARKNNLKVMLEYGDCTGELELKDRTASEIVRDFVDFASTEQMMIFDRMSESYVNQLLDQYQAFETAASAFKNVFTPKTEIQTES